MPEPGHRPNPLRPRRAAAACVWLAGLLAVSGCGGSGSPESDQSTLAGSAEQDAPPIALEHALGWDPRVPFARALEHAPVFASIAAREGDFEGTLRVVAPLQGPEGSRKITHELPVEVPRGGKKRFELPILIGAEPAAIDVELVTASGRVVVADILQPILARPDDVLVAVFSARRGSHNVMGQGAGRRHLYPLGSWLPRNPAAMSAIDAVVIDARSLPELEDAGRIAALADFVEKGGHLIVALGPLGPPILSEAFGRLLPARRDGKLGSFDVRPWLEAHYPGSVQWQKATEGEQDGEGEKKGGDEAKEPEEGEKDDAKDEEDEPDEAEAEDEEDGDEKDGADEVQVELGVFTAWPLRATDPSATLLIEGERLPENRAKKKRKKEDGDEPAEPEEPPPPPDPDVGKVQPLGFSAARGRGRVTVLGFSLLDPGATGFIADPELTARLLRRRPESPLARHAPREIDPAASNPFAINRPVRLVEDDVVRDMGNHLKQTTLFSVPPKRVVAGFLAIYIVTLVPGLVLLFRATKRTEWFWGAVPLVAAGFVFAAWRMSESTAGRHVALTSVEMVDVGSGETIGSSRTVISLYSPAGRAYDLQLPPGARPISPRVTQIRGTEAPPLEVDEPGLNEERGAIVRTFAVLAKDSRLVEMDATAELDGPLGLKVAFTADTRGGYEFDGQLVNESDVSYEDVLVVFGGRLVDLGRVEAGQTVRVPGRPHTPTSSRAGALKGLARAESNRLQNAPAPARGEDAATGRAKEALRHVRNEAIASLLLRIDRERLDRVRPIAILTTPTPEPGITVDGSEVETVGWRIIALHGEATPREGTTLYDVRTRMSARPRRSSSFVQDGPVIDFADGMVDVELEVEHVPEGFVIAAYRIDLDFSTGAAARLPRILELGPERQWKRLDAELHPDARGARHNAMLGPFVVKSASRPTTFARLRLVALTDDDTYIQHRVARIQPILERRGP